MGAAGIVGGVGGIGTVEAAGAVGVVGGDVGATVLRGGVSGQMFLRANEKASRVLVAAAQRRGLRPNQEGAASAGVDDSGSLERGDIEKGMPDVKGCPLPDTYASSCWVGRTSSCIPGTHTPLHKNPYSFQSHPPSCVQTTFYTPHITSIQSLKTRRP